MAARAIARAFADLPCGSLAAPGGVRVFAGWSAAGEGDLISSLRADGVDTVVLVRIEELTPTLAVTFSVPFLWVGTSEADFRVRALRTADGPVILDRRIRRVSNGPFQLRPASWAEPELEAGLRQVVPND